MAQGSRLVLILILMLALVGPAGGQTQRFFDDDPIQRLPPPLPVRKPARQDINEVLDLLSRSRTPSARAVKPAGAVNTIGEVPDSEWFTTRNSSHHMTPDELKRGAAVSEGPLPPFTITGGKTQGVTLGFRMTDAMHRKYFVKVDPLKYPEMASSADVIVSRFLYAIGYNTPDNEIVDVKPADLRLADKATITPAGERPRKMTWTDVEQLVKEVPHYPDGSFRIMASLAIEGENIGPFAYEGVRRDDPNDIVPHEDRRDLRGLYVFSAWLNNTDTKPTNSLDTVVSENGIRFIRHYQLDFGNALGSDGDAPKDPRLGNEFLLPTPAAALEHILSLGVFPAPWETVDFPKLRGVGRFESQLFDPGNWKPGYPNPAFTNRLPDDEYWAAKQVMAFTDDDIRAIVETARFTDPRATDYITKTLEERRDKIGRTFFSKLPPLDRFRVENGQLAFDDLAVNYGFHAPRSYDVRWSSFDNVQQKHEALPGGESAHLPAEVLQAAPGSYFLAAVGISGASLRPVSVYIRKSGSGYKIVGIDR